MTRQCDCRHSLEWAHYRRLPGNGQMWDWICVDCLGSTNRAFHEPTEGGVPALLTDGQITKEENDGNR